MALGPISEMASAASARGSHLPEGTHPAHHQSWALNPLPLTAQPSLQTTEPPGPLPSSLSLLAMGLLSSQSLGPAHRSLPKDSSWASPFQTTTCEVWSPIISGPKLRPSLPLPIFMQGSCLPLSHSGESLGLWLSLCKRGHGPCPNA